MILNEESVAAYTTLLTKPEENGLSFKPLNECLVRSDKVTALHILFKDYIDYIKKPLPKLFFYIILQNIYGNPTGKDQNGYAGYHLQLFNLQDSGEEIRIEVGVGN